MLTWSSKKMESAEDLNPKAYQILTLLLDTELSQDTCTAVSQYYYLKQKCFFLSHSISSVFAVPQKKETKAH